MKKRLGIILTLCLIFTLSSVNAEDHIISNSANWQDVYSSMLYATLKGSGSDFLASTPHGPTLLNGINKQNNLIIITSKNHPLVFNYPSLARSRGFDSVEEIVVSSGNLDLIQNLPGIKNFIVVGDSYGYNSMAVVAYALSTNSWVFLANRVNIDDVDSILRSRGVNNLILYGYVDSEVTESLLKYNPEIINTGDRFEDNIQLIKRYSQVGSITQIILSNGEFIEKEIMQGKNALLFTGKENVPPKIAEYLKSSEVEIGVLIGNELVGAASNIRQSTGINVMVKFARSSRETTAGVAPVEGLDLFYIPVPNLNIVVYSVKYNRATSRLEITYRSDSNMPAYIQGTIEIVTPSGTIRVGDVGDPIFIAPGDFKTVVYDGVVISGEEATANVNVLYGETPSSLDRVLRGTYEIEIVNIIDRCDLDIKSIKYNRQEDSFIVRLKSTVPVECWTSVELRDITINRITQTIGTEESERILPKKSKNIFIYEILTESDLTKNKFVRVVSYYGERRDSLVNTKEAKMELKYQRFNALTYVIFILSLLILIFIIFFIIARRREKKEDD